MLTLQTPAITIPNELTVSHAWKDEKKPREYDFDAVFGPGASQVWAARAVTLILIVWAGRGAEGSVLGPSRRLLLRGSCCSDAQRGGFTQRGMQACRAAMLFSKHKLSRTQVCTIPLSDRHCLLLSHALRLQEEIFEDTKHLVRSALDGEWLVG